MEGAGAQYTNTPPQPILTGKVGMDSPIAQFDHALERLNQAIDDLSGRTESLRIHIPEESRRDDEPEQPHAILSRVRALNLLTARLEYATRTISL